MTSDERDEHKEGDEGASASEGKGRAGEKPEPEEAEPEEAEPEERKEPEKPAALSLAETDAGKNATRAKPSKTTVRGSRGRTYRVRGELPLVWRFLMGVLCVGLIGLAWWAATRGAAEERMISPAVLGSPAEVFGSFHSLWFDRALTRNMMLSLARVLKGFGLALLIGLPLGVLSGVFPRIRAFLAPITIAGRNIPVAALVPLTLVWFGLGETQKVMFIFIACVAFILFDVTETIMAVDQKYVDTAYTLGANRWQIIFKVLVPLAMPKIFNSARLLLGLGFGYIILTEIVGAEGGLGNLIAQSQRRGPREHVYLTLIVITLVAYALDRIVALVGTYLFPYKESR